MARTCLNRLWIAALCSLYAALPASAATPCGSETDLPAELCPLALQAEGGDPQALWRLGWHYAAGRGVAQNFVRAATLARQAAEMGYAPAASDLGFYYFNGHGVEKDPLAAERWWRVAAARGDKLALSSLGFQLAEKAQQMPLAEQRQYHLAAFQLWLEACSAGDPAACGELKSALQEGRGVPSDVALAQKWDAMTPVARYQQARASLSRSSVFSYELDAIPPGGCQLVEWPRTPTRVLPVFICHRTEAMISALPESGADHKVSQQLATRYAHNLADTALAAEVMAMGEQLAHKAGRSIEPQWLVLAALEPRFGCVTTAQSETGQFSFYNPCHGDRWDALGQPRHEDSTAPADTLPLMTPPYRFQASKLMLGELPDQSPISYPPLQPSPPAAGAPPEQHLLFAVRWQEPEMLRRLLGQGAGQAPLTEQQQADILIQAVSMQYLPNILMLLEHGFKPTARTRFGSDAIGVAAIVDNHAITTLLKEYLPSD